MSIEEKRTNIEAQGCEIGIYLSDPNAKLPTLAYDGDVGYDLYAIEDVSIPAGCVKLVRTGVHLVMPKEIFAQVNTRSSFGQRGAILHHGVIDSGFTGEISVWVMNVAKPIDDRGLQRINTITIEKGNKVGQLLFHKAERVQIKQVETLPKTERGDKGHGSTGK